MKKGVSYLVIEIHGLDKQLGWQNHSRFLTEYIDVHPTAILQALGPEVQVNMQKAWKFACCREHKTIIKLHKERVDNGNDARLELCQELYFIDESGFNLHTGRKITVEKLQSLFETYTSQRHCLNWKRHYAQYTRNISAAGVTDMAFKKLQAVSLSTELTAVLNE